MKSFKYTILAATALVLAVSAARADDLLGLKMRMQTLDSDQAAALIGTSAIYDKDDVVHSIGIMPTADAPAAAAPTTVLTWSGYIRGGVRGAHDQYAGLNAGFNATGVAGAYTGPGVGAASGAGYSNVNGTLPSWPLDVAGRADMKVAFATDTDLGQFGG